MPYGTPGSLILDPLDLLIRRFLAGNDDADDTAESRYVQQSEWTYVS